MSGDMANVHRLGCNVSRGKAEGDIASQPVDIHHVTRHEGQHFLSHTESKIFESGHGE